MKDNRLKITIIQADLAWEKKEDNLNSFSEKLNQITEPTDIIVLPEMFTTGFSMKAEKLAEDWNGKTIEWIKQKAKEKNSVIACSLIFSENKKFYNRLIWMNPDGSYQYYDKRHLFRMVNEQKYYTAGNTKLIVEFKSWKICPLICYDLRFPVWCRNQDDYDVLIYIANWPEKRIYTWKTLLLARAIENQAYVIAVNRVGKDGNGIIYSGDSAVINPKGYIISKTQPYKESVETLALSKDELNNLRKAYPVKLDADEFEMNL